MIDFNNVKWNENLISGSLNLVTLYTNIYNKVPNVFYYALDKFSIQIENIDYSKLSNYFPNSKIIVTSGKRMQTNSSVSEINIVNSNIEEMYSLSHYVEYSIIIITDNIFYSITSDLITIYYSDFNLNLNDLITEILKFLTIKSKELNSTEIQLVGWDNGYYTITSQIESTTVNINENYNDDFIPVYEDIKSFLNIRKSGLIILRGLMGTGKTTFIRHLITNYSKDYILLPNSLVDQISSPEFISFMLEHKDSTFILEDCEQVLIDRSYNAFNNSISSILNMSDGLMSDIFNVKFICTFNADINKIDPAILRKGRCFANYEFKKLNSDKTKILLNKNGIELDKYNPMTLAEIYNYSDQSYIEDNKSIKIGF